MQRSQASPLPTGGPLTHLAQRQALLPLLELALHLLDCHHLPRLSVDRLEHAAVRAVAQLRGHLVSLHRARAAAAVEAAGHRRRVGRSTPTGCEGGAPAQSLRRAL